MWEEFQQKAIDTVCLVTWTLSNLLTKKHLMDNITGQSCWPPTLWLELVNFVQKSCCIFDFYACFDSEIKVILWLKLTNMQGHTFQNIITKIKPITLPIIIGVCFTQKVLMKCGIDNISTENGRRKYWFLHLGNCKNSNSCRKY